MSCYFSTLTRVCRRRRSATSPARWAILRYVGGRFDVELDGKHWLLPLVGRLISYLQLCRSRHWRSGAIRAPRCVPAHGRFRRHPLDGRHRVLPRAQAAG